MFKWKKKIFPAEVKHGPQWTHSPTNNENTSKTIRFKRFRTLQFNQRHRTNKQNLLKNNYQISFKKQWSLCHFHSGISPNPVPPQIRVTWTWDACSLTAAREHWPLWSSGKKVPSQEDALSFFPSNEQLPETFSSPGWGFYLIWLKAQIRWNTSSFQAISENNSNLLKWF